MSAKPADQTAGRHAAEVRLAPTEVALFASDMHLDGRGQGLAERFFAELRAAVRDAGPRVAVVFLLGDLFEAWVGDDDDDPAADGLARTLSELRAEGARIVLMRGNRDFLLGRSPPGFAGQPYAARCAASLVDEPLVVEMFGERVVLAHGDALCTDDHAYQEFRALSRSDAWQAAMLAKPLAERRTIARAYRAESQTRRRSKPAPIADVNPRAVAALLRGCDATTLVHGHTHRPDRHLLPPADAPGGVRWVLPDWSQRPLMGGFLRRDARGWTRLGRWAPD